MELSALTIGHSTTAIGRFCELLEAHGVDCVADVRSVPFSRWTPQFNRDVLDRELASRGVSYGFFGAELGARSSDPGAYQAGKVSYEYLARTSEFQGGLSRLIDRLGARRVAILCTEGDPLQCHRAVLVARALKARGVLVRHILPEGGLMTQDECEERLLELHRMSHGDLFTSTDELVERAYQLQGQKIAYVRDRTADDLQDSEP